MPGFFDFDNGNGVYDVVTRKDYERWREEEHEKHEKRKQDLLSNEEEEDISSKVPF